MTATTDIVQKLWGLCNALRDDGISYLQYTTELTYLLFLKMTQERGMEDKLPEGYRWNDLTGKDGIEQLNFYRELLLHLGSQEAKPLVQAIYANANTALKKPTILKKLSTNIDELDWYSAKEEGLGDLYEGLLEKNATEKKSGAGQYFTPRQLIDCIVELMQPQAKETIQDPADTLASEGQRLPKADLMLSNPPFGTKTAGGKPTRDDFTYPTSNKQLAFLQHIYRGLKPGGRAAVVLPDNVLFEDGQGRAIRADLMEKCNLHTILRLPTGIFYSPGVKTNVLFFQRGATEKGNTAAVWVYDLRTNMPSFGKRTPLTREHFQPFMDVYGDEPNGGSERVDTGEEGRFRCFSREEIAKRGDNLDLSWLRDESLQSADDLPEPGVIALRIMERLETAMEEMEALKDLLEVGEEEVV